MYDLGIFSPNYVQMYIHIWYVANNLALIAPVLSTDLTSNSYLNTYVY
jgi:hypothetical protein